MTEHESERKRCPCGCGIFMPDENWWERHFGPDHCCRLCGISSLSSRLSDSIIKDRQGNDIFCPLCQLSILESQFERHVTRLARVQGTLKPFTRPTATSRISSNENQPEEDVMWIEVTMGDWWRLLAATGSVTVDYLRSLPPGARPSEEFLATLPEDIGLAGHPPNPMGSMAQYDDPEQGS